VRFLKRARISNKKFLQLLLLLSPLLFIQESVNEEEAQIWNVGAAKTSYDEAFIIHLLGFLIQLVNNDIDIFTVILLLSNMLFEELSSFQMNGQNGLHFVFEISIMDASLC
jgi:hypothetical protein